MGAVDSQVPATANSQVIAFGDEVQHPAVAERIYYLARSVGRVIVHHYYIEREGCLLFQHRAYRIGDCRTAVQDGDNHRCLNRELPCRQVYRGVFAWGQPCTYCLEMIRTHLFHLNLHLTLRRIHIVELFFATFAGIILAFRIKIIAMMIYMPYAAHGKPQLVEASIFILVGRLCEITFQCRCPEKQHRPEVEVITQRTGEIVYRWSLCHHTIYTFHVM